MKETGNTEDEKKRQPESNKPTKQIKMNQTGEPKATNKSTRRSKSKKATKATTHNPKSNKPNKQ
jgi:hypothetical protein